MIYDDLVVELGNPLAEPEQRELLEPRLPRQIQRISVEVCDEPEGC